MRISDFRNLISELPELQHSFKIKAEHWKPILESSIYQKFFNDKEFIELNRFDIINSGSSEDLIIKTLLWGYPTVGRGNNISNLLEEKNFEKLVTLLDSYRKIQNVSFEKLLKDLKEIKGLGKSTLTKLLFFSYIQVNSLKSIIFDDKIIQVLKSGKFEEFDSFYKLQNITFEKNFTDYLKTISTISESISVKEEQIELFLFIFGNHLTELRGEEFYDEID